MNLFYLNQNYQNYFISIRTIRTIRTFISISGMPANTY